MLKEEKLLLEKEKRGLKEERGGMEEERDMLLKQNLEYQRSSQDQTVYIGLLNEQLKQYESDFRNEHDQKERFADANCKLRKENTNLKASLHEVSVALL